MNDLFSNSAGNPNSSGAVHTLRGIMKRLIFSNNEGSYAVIALEAQDLPTEVTATGNGSLISLSPGEEIEAEGTWETHKSFGRQFRIKNFNRVLPGNEEGLIRYLSSEIFPGVGPKTAERIVNTFGLETPKILSQYSSRLKEVPGLGKKKALEIKTAWQSVEGNREQDIFLQSLEISHSQAYKINAVYGEDTVQTIQENPYKLYKDISGIGFKSCDRIAEKLNIPKNSPYRLENGISYTLEHACDFGHTSYPRDLLIQKAAEILQVSPQECELALDQALEKKLIRAEEHFHKGQVRQFIYTTKLYFAEQNITESIEFLLSAPKSERIIDCSALDHNLNNEQQTAVRNAFASKISIVTGGPGVGKTTTIKEIVRIARENKLSIQLAAPTGRAARRMTESSGETASTIHRLLNFDHASGGFTHNRHDPLKCQVLIIDEASMIDLRLAASLFEAVPSECHLILTGDRDQLPSVGPGKVLADLLDTEQIPSTMLTQIYRQAANSHIITNSHLVNRGQIPNLTPPPQNEISDFYWINQSDPNKILSTINQMVTQRITARFGLSSKQIQILSPMNKGDLGTEALNISLQNALNSKTKMNFDNNNRNFRVGDRVIQTKNNYDKNVFNGDLGYIQSLDFKEKTFTIMFENANVEYDFSDANQINLAYCITIHKSQGSEFPAVIIPLTEQHNIMLQKNLLYTAMTRAKKLLILIGSQSALQKAVGNTKSLHRFSQLSSKLKKLQ